MKLLIIFFCSIFYGVIFSDWKLASVYNQSDLKLDGAYRLTNKLGKKKKSSTFVEKRVKSATSKPFVVIDYTVPTNPKSQGNLCILGINPSQQRYEICFDSQPQHAMKWNRSAAKNVAAYDEQTDLLADASDDSLVARAVLKLNEKVMVQAMQPYDLEQKNVEFDLTIQGTAGSYALELSPVT